MGLDSTAQAAFLAKSQLALEELFPGEITIGGTDYTCALGGRMMSQKLESDYGGYIEGDGYNVRVRKDLIAYIAIEAEIGQRVQIGGVDWRLNAFSVTAYDTAWKLELIPIR